MLVIAGLTVELGCTIWSSPATLNLMMLVGVPLVLLGIAVFANALWEILAKQAEGLATRGRTSKDRVDLG